jgi:hypothetical protein
MIWFGHFQEFDRSQTQQKAALKFDIFGNVKERFYGACYGQVGQRKGLENCERLHGSGTSNIAMEQQQPVLGSSSLTASTAASDVFQPYNQN